jgi:hypothetical protein
MTRALTLALLLLSVARPLEAQGHSDRFPRSYLMAGVGALAMGAVGTLYALSFDQDIGSCARASCVVPVSVLFGAGIGFLIGSELDDLYAVRYSHAPPISVRGRELTLSLMPHDVLVRDSTVLVTGGDGIEVIRAGPTLERLGLRARGLRGIGPVASDERRNLLLVGSPMGLYRFPLQGEDPGTLAHPGEISALSRDGSTLALGTGLDVRLARIGDSLAPMGAAITEDTRVMDLAWHGDTLLWVLTEERLAGYARAGDSLVPRGAVPFPTLTRRLALREGTAFVAAGSGGVYAVDVRDPAAPREVGNWSGARFAYDADAVGDIVYVAAGPEGLYILRLTPDGFAPIGLSRGLGFVAAVETGPGGVYVLDRNGAVLRRLDPLSPK